MSDEIRYTTRNDGPTRSRARLDTGTRALLVVTSATARAASPDKRNRIAARAGLPVQVVTELAERGEPIIVHRANDPSEAQHAQARLQDQDALPTELVLDGNTAIPGAALAAGAIGMLTLVLGGGLLLLDTTLGLLALGLTAALFVATGWLWRKARSSGTLLHAANTGEARARSAMQGKEQALTPLAALRDASLAPDLPVEAQVDLWRSLDQLERAVLDGSLDPEGVRPRIEAIQQSLTTGGAAQHAALTHLSRTIRAISASRQDATGGGG
jgi:hypothetical protein